MTIDFRHPLRVYWEDTDAGGVVFYANYLKFFERARTEWLRSFGFGQEQLRRDTGAMFVVSETSVRYLRPARLDDLLQITVEVTDRRMASMTVAQQAWRLHVDASPADAGSAAPAGALLLAEGSIRIGCVDADSFKPRRIPIDLFDRTR